MHFKPDGLLFITDSWRDININYGLGEWVHLTLTGDNGFNKLYVNGELKSTKVGATPKSDIVAWIKENI